MPKKHLRHLAIILDGNRRWARKRGLPTFYGHKKGFDNLKKISKHCFKSGISTLTVYAFSVQNWNRSKREVNYLMGLFRGMLNTQIEELRREEIRVIFLGERSRFDRKMQSAMTDAEQTTRKGKQGTLNICFNYGGQEEIVRAVKNIIAKKVPAKKISKALLDKYMYTAGQDYPDMIIRTSGENRLSNFLTWQSAYAELYFTKTTWPDFGIREFDKAVEEYQKRHRRFGK